MRHFSFRLAKLTKTFRDHFLRPDQLAAPEKPSLQSHQNASIVFRKLCRLVTHDAMNSQIDVFLRLNFPDFEAVENFDERMDRILQIITPLGDVFACPLLFRSGAQLLAEAAEIVIQHHEIVNEWFLERFVDEIVTIFSQLSVK